MTATNAEYSKYFNCDMSVLIHHLQGMYQADIMYDQFALAISYSNQSTIGLLTNTALMMSSLYHAGCGNDNTVGNCAPLVRPFNILLELKNTHTFRNQEKILCNYKFCQKGSRFKGLEHEYTKLKRSLDTTEQITMKLRG
jgi:hypothetical protein